MGGVWGRTMSCKLPHLQTHSFILFCMTDPLQSCFAAGRILMLEEVILLLLHLKYTGYSIVQLLVFGSARYEHWLWNMED